MNDEGLGKIQEDSATSCETDSKLVSTDKLSPKNGGATVGKGTLIGSIGATAAVTSAVTEGISSKIASSKNNNDKVSGTNEELEELEKRIEELKEQNSSLNNEISGLNGKIEKLEQKIPAGGVKGFLKGWKMDMLYFLMNVVVLIILLPILESTICKESYESDKKLQRSDEPLDNH